MKSRESLSQPFRELLSTFDVKEWFSCVKNRQTTHPEDQAYSLLGIFNVSMPAMYGEGRDGAFDGLRNEIDRPSKDILPTPFNTSRRDEASNNL